MNIAEKITELLDEEYRLLTRADYAALPELTERKERLARQLRELPGPDRAALATLAKAVARNAELIEAARRGIEQARVQIRDIREGMTQTTYCRSGVRRPLSRNPSRIEQKL
jgi:flagellar biosynthesis/type III secretory pathway chaperone